MMKKVLLTIALSFACITAFAQTEGGFGIKGGLNYGQNGDL